MTDRETPEAIADRIVKKEGFAVVDTTQAVGFPRYTLHALQAAIVAAIKRERGDDVKHAAHNLCSDCPPIGYPTNKTRCFSCPRDTIPREPPEAIASAIKKESGR